MTQPTGERQLLIRAKLLIAEENHQMLEPGRPNLCNYVVCQMGATIHPAYDRADGAGQRRYLDLLVSWKLHFTRPPGRN
jgi:hypothetical protein